MDDLREGHSMNFKIIDIEKKNGTLRYKVKLTMKHYKMKLVHRMKLEFQIKLMELTLHNASKVKGATTRRRFVNIKVKSYSG